MNIDRATSALANMKRKSTAKRASGSLDPVVSWRPIATAPTKERKPIWLKVPGREPAAAYSDTFWISGFSVECKPTHWKPRTEPANDTLCRPADSETGAQKGQSK